MYIPDLIVHIGYIYGIYISNFSNDIHRYLNFYLYICIYSVSLIIPSPIFYKTCVDRRPGVGFADMALAQQRLYSPLRHHDLWALSPAQIPSRPSQPPGIRETCQYAS